MRFDETEIRVRFNEVDSWGIAWHGHYLAWFEVGRMALLRKFQLLPQDFTRMGYVAPVVDLKCVYKEPARLDEEIIIRTTVQKPTKAALTFQFEILRKSDRKLLATGEETQVLLALDGRMLYYIPPDLQKKLQPLFRYLEGPNSPA
jgi:acyl-CoA thioester hydrolase